MRKVFTFIAAMLVAFAANAAVININTGTADALRLALNDANDGDEIVMAAGTYVESNGNYIAFTGKHVTVKAAEGAEVLIQPQVPITISEGGCAHFVGVKFDVSRLNELATWYEHLMYAADASAGNSIILDGCELYNFNINKSMLYCSTANVLASVSINNCYFHNILKSILFVENTGAMNLSVTNSTFANISTNTESYWAGVIDVRASGSTVNVDHCTFYNVIPMNTDYSAVSKVAIANGVVSNSIFMLPTATDGIRAIRGLAHANNCITYNYLKDEGTGIHSSVSPTNCYQVNPLFVDAANADFHLQVAGTRSPALNAGVSGTHMGDPRWYPVFNVRGTMNEWSATEDEMAWDDTKHIYFKQLDLAAGTYQFKINHGAWAADWGGSNIAGALGDVALSNVDGNISMTTDGRPVIVYFDLANNVVWADYLYPKVMVVGNFTEPAWQGILMDDEDALSCHITITVPEGRWEFKIIDNNVWYGANGDVDRTNCTDWTLYKEGDPGYDPNINTGLLADIPGDYVLTYTYATNKLDIVYPTSFTRNAANDNYQTLCVPFNASITNAQIFDFVGVANGAVTIQEIDPALLTAGKSYIVKPSGNMEITKVGEGQVSNPIFPTSAGLYGVLGADYTYVYATESEKSWVNNYVLIAADNLFHEVIAGGEVTIKSTRAYLHLAAPIQAPSLRIIEAENGATNIQNVEGNEAAVKFIQNGQLYIKKNGVVYTAAGVAVK